VLSDPEKRKKYDRFGHNWQQMDAAEKAGANVGGFDGFGGFRGSRGRRATNFGGTTVETDDLGDLGDIFDQLFGGSGGIGGRRRGPRRGQDIEYPISVSLEEAFAGTLRTIQIQQPDGGLQTLEVKIPAGVTDGSRVRVPGEGEMGTGGAQSGDLYLRIRLASHPQFERKGRDLHTRVLVPLTTAVLGGEADVPAFSGKTLRLKVPPMTQNGQVFRLRGHGMPVVGKPNEYGDLYATVDVQLPRTLTQEQRKHFEELKRLEKGATHSAA
jgi:DnaJ-class molecular chaperone